MNIIDKFSVSEEAYDELTQQEPALPRTYLVKACQQTLDEQWNVIRTPGEFPGAELPLKLLLENELRRQVSTAMAFTSVSLLVQRSTGLRLKFHNTTWNKIRDLEIRMTMHIMLTPITLFCYPWLQLKDSVEEEPTVKVKISRD